MATGTCISDTFFYVNNKNDKDLLIIHALVKRISDGLQHPHAVVYNKKDKNIYEVSNSFKQKPIIIDFKTWLILGNVSRIKLYTIDEFRNLLLNKKTWDFYHLQN